MPRNVMYSQSVVVIMTNPASLAPPLLRAVIGTEAIVAMTRASLKTVKAVATG